MVKLQFKSGRLPDRFMIPTQSYSLNRALGGGLQSGRMHVLWGKKGSTKSTTALYVVANAQKMGKRCVYVDSERSLDEDYAEKCGVDLDNNFVWAAEEGVNVAEDILETLVPMLEKDQADLVVFDSLSSIFLKSYHDKPDTNAIGIGSRTAKFVISKLLNHLPRSRMMIFISHASMDLSGYHPRLTAQIGNAQEHWTSNIIKFAALESKIKDNGFRTIDWKIEKTKTPTWPFSGEYDFNGLTGQVDNIGELVTIGKEIDLIQGSSWLSFGNQKFHGQQALTDSLYEDSSLKQMLQDAIEEYDSRFRTSMLTTANEYDNTMEQENE